MARIAPGKLAGMDSDVHTNLKAAFPWFDDYRWAWSYDPDDDGAPAYLIRPAPPAARGTIQIFMPTATHEQAEAIRVWLIGQCCPRYEVPATRFLMALGDRSRADNPAWSHLMV
jgi:hypothetical protein